MRAPRYFIHRVIPPKFNKISKEVIITNETPLILEILYIAENGWEGRLEQIPIMILDKMRTGAGGPLQ